MSERTFTCTRCGRTGLDSGDVWLGEDADDSAEAWRCINCLTDEERAEISDHYRSVAREEMKLISALDRELPSDSPRREDMLEKEGHVEHLQREADRILRPGG